VRQIFVAVGGDNVGGGGGIQASGPERKLGCRSDMQADRWKRDMPAGIRFEDWSKADSRNIVYQYIPSESNSFLLVNVTT
jgi:hypothetical protein